jgi:hypothetical protein
LNILVQQIERAHGDMGFFVWNMARVFLFTAGARGTRGRPGVMPAQQQKKTKLFCATKKSRKFSGPDPEASGNPSMTGTYSKPAPQKQKDLPNK